MAATFGSPVSAVLIAIELLLFEYRPRSVIPVALASAVASAARGAMVGFSPVFAMPSVQAPSSSALATYVALGAVVGLGSVFVTRAVYWIEDAFARLPLHWMWWPALGAVAVGVVGYFAPSTLGMGYDNIDAILSGDVFGRAALVLCVAKFISWSLALGSGTSGGTLAPLFTIGGALGSALVGMSSMFAGASHATLPSVIFAFETTRQPLGLLPLLGGCTAAYLISCLMMSTSIMTEKIARRGALVKTEYAVDLQEQVLVRDFATHPVVVVRADDRLHQARASLVSNPDATTHHGFPVVEANESLLGVLTRTDLFGAAHDGERTVRELVHSPPVVIHDDSTLREAIDTMVDADVGRLPVVSREAPHKIVGIVTRRDLLAAHKRRLDHARVAEPTIGFKDILLRGG